MPIVSAVIYARPEHVGPLVAELTTDPRLTVAAPHADRFAMVADTTTRAEDKALWRGLEQHRDILRIELVVAQFDDIHPQEVP